MAFSRLPIGTSPIRNASPLGDTTITEMLVENTVPCSSTSGC